MKSLHPGEIEIITGISDRFCHDAEQRNRKLLTRLRETEKWREDDLVHIQPVFPAKGGVPRYILVSGWYIYLVAVELQEEMLSRGTSLQQHDLSFLQCVMLPSWTDLEFTDEKLAQSVISTRHRNRESAHYSISEELKLAAWIELLELQRINKVNNTRRPRTRVNNLAKFISDKEGGGAPTKKYWTRVLAFKDVDKESLNLLSYLEDSSVSLSCIHDVQCMSDTFCIAVGALQVY